MRFMMFIKHLEDYYGRDVPAGLFAAMDELVEENTKKGVLIDTAGLQPLAKSTRIRLAGGKIQVTDGPFTESKEVVGGYALCEIATHDEAVAFATKFMDVHRIHWPEFEGEVEVRPLETGAP
ncbi:MAG TPA: YciI family protein [Longimicrobiales bacterium]